jgi:hypothetical protein
MEMLVLFETSCLIVERDWTWGQDAQMHAWTALGGFFIIVEATAASLRQGCRWSDCSW